MRRVGAVGALLALLALAPAGPTVADSRQTGLIEGRVLDAAGAPLQGVEVGLVGDRGSRSGTTDAHGRFLFGPLGAGDYVAKVALAGSVSNEQAIHLEAGEQHTVDFRLAIESAETIDVIAAASLVDPHRAGTSSTLEADVAAELVFSTRNYHSMTVMLPGAVHMAQNNSDGAPAVNGALWLENGAFVDGVDVSNSRFGGGSQIFFPSSTLAEIRSDGSGYGAEYGRAVGGVTEVVTKSGTNEFHGDLLYIAQNPSWRAPSEVAPVEREDRLISSYETSLGGPLLRDRLWFFAALGETNTNQSSPLAGGEVIDSSLQAESTIGKLTIDTSPRHHVGVTAIEGLGVEPLFSPFTAERAAATSSERGGRFVIAAWSWTAATTRFLEVRAAGQRSQQDRTPVVESAVDPGVSPDDPARNRGAYFDTASGLRWHGSDLPLGPGLFEFPREQTNATFTLLLEEHAFEVGADYQDLAWEALNRPPDRYFGRGYDPELPGGFAQPSLKRVFIPAESPVETTSSNLGLFAQDRVDIGSRWSLSVGLRVEDQTHDDDLGRQVLASTDFAPRTSIVYDVGGEGRLLIKATAGRYFTQITQDFVNREFASRSNGANAFDEYLWDPATQRYAIFNRSQLPAVRSPVGDVEPYAKDEVTAGVEWQMNDVWVLDARAIAWQIDSPYTGTDQFDDLGNVYRLLANFDEAERRYRGLQIEVNRALRDGLAVRANYTLSKAEGNSSGNEAADPVADDFLEARTVLDPVSGLPVTAVHRYGRLMHDRTHVLNLAGAKRWASNKSGHSFALAGWLAFRSGQPWGLRPTVSLRAPGASASIMTTRYVEPRDANELPDNYTLNATASWEFPIAGRASGSLRAELVNATDEQEQTDVIFETGEPIEVPQSYQTPREVRVVLGVRF